MHSASAWEDFRIQSAASDDVDHDGPPENAALELLDVVNGLKEMCSGRSSKPQARPRNDRIAGAARGGQPRSGLSAEFSISMVASLTRFSGDNPSNARARNSRLGTDALSGVVVQALVQALVQAPDPSLVTPELATLIEWFLCLSRMRSRVRVSSLPPLKFAENAPKSRDFGAFFVYAIASGHGAFNS